MPENACPICAATRRFTPLEGLRRLERRRFPRGKLACPHEGQRWHWQLERLRRELDLTRDAKTLAALQSEYEDILIQHQTVAPLEVMR